MTITVTDPVLLGELSCIDGSIDLTDPQGRVLGTFFVDDDCKLPPGVKSPFSDAEMAERRKDRTGRPLADILRDLDARQ